MQEAYLMRRHWDEKTFTKLEIAEFDFADDKEIK